MNETTAKLLYSDNIGITLTTDKSKIIVIIASPFIFKQRVGSVLQKASYTFLQVRPEATLKLQTNLYYLYLVAVFYKLYFEPRNSLYYINYK